jgi:YidC/Oxa1 family membrane protein insertase
MFWDTFILDPMINTLLRIYDLLGNNFGIAIVVFTAVIRALTLPLTFQQQRSTQKMQEMQKSKRWQDIQKKYKGEKQKQQEETMKLYKELGINPLAGCLPMLIQFPIIIGLYQSITRALASTPVELLDLSRHLYSWNPPSLIPLHSQFLWMNLAQPERLFLPFLPTVGIPVLTILVVISTYLQTKLTTPPSADAQGSQMTKMMSLYMPFLLGWIAYTLSAGLALYFVTSNVLAIVQYAVMGKVNWRSLIPGRAVVSQKP